LLKTIAILNGHNSEDHVRAAGPDAAVTSFAEIKRLLI
jgi:phosphoglycolate phosphatase-like HAD superfamily hydrolase